MYNTMYVCMYVRLYLVVQRATTISHADYRLFVMLWGTGLYGHRLNSVQTTE